MNTPTEMSDQGYQRESGGRRYNTVGALARMGFSTADRTMGLFSSPVLAGLVDDYEDSTGLLRAVAYTADPDQALLTVVRLLEALDSLSSGAGGIGAHGASGSAGDLGSSGGFGGQADSSPGALRTFFSYHCPERDRILGVLGTSRALGDYLVAHPQDWTYAAHATAMSGADRVAALVHDVSPASDLRRGGRSAQDALRIGYRRQMLGILARDVTEVDPTTILPETARALADLAGAALEAGLAVAREDHPELAAQTRLAVMGMGKCGGLELNYVSDVDVIFVAEPADGVAESVAIAAATTLASATMKACAAKTAEGTLWPVDAALRPEGAQGPLVRTVASHRQYYERWAKTWEFQALLKARHVAGDPEVAQAYLDAITPMVWQAASRENFVEDVQQMRRRVEEHVPAAQAGRQLKLGPGGLRDVEFSVQLLQLVHGRTDDTLRSRNTLQALSALAAGGYVGRDDAAELDQSYRLLRSLEHRLQMYRMRRTHLMPDNTPADAPEWRRLGRAMHLRSEPEREVRELWQGHAREVRKIHERLFYGPLLAAAARLSAADSQLSSEAARERLAALGFRDPAGAMRHLEALTSGMSRTAAMQRTLLPIMLGWFADEADPDAGLLAFRKVSESLGGTHWFLKMLRDSGNAADRLAHVLARSRYAVELLERAPESVSILGDEEGLLPRTRDQLLTTMRAAMKRKDDADSALLAVRVIRRQELFRVVLADLVGAISEEQVQQALTDLTEAVLECALYVATKRSAESRDVQVSADIAMIGMGRLGGAECGYGSDADVMYVYRPREGFTEHEAQSLTLAVVQEVKRSLAAAGPDPVLAVDTDLRPEGKAGPLARSLDSYAAYYERWSNPWEAQALVRARPVAGDVALGEAFVELIAPRRWPADGLDSAALKEIRRLKARMEAERLPRGADPKLHVKLGPGGLSDVEWTVQLMQLRHAHEVEGLRTTRTMAALEAARAASLLSEGDAQVLRQSWRFASRMRNATMLWRGRASDSVPVDLRDAEGVTRILGLPAGEGAQLAERYRRRARRARLVTEREFFGV